MAELNADLVRQALAQNGGKVTATARALGVSRQTLYRWMRKHAIEIERVVKAA